MMRKTKCYIKIFEIHKTRFTTYFAKSKSKFYSKIKIVCYCVSFMLSCKSIETNLPPK